jgi:prepilin-type N-terminal cleavage/methylation domain-containing protein
MDATATSTRPTEQHPPPATAGKLWASCGRSLQIARRERHGSRRGFSLVEVTVAAVVLSALVVMLGQAIGWVAVARRDSDRRQIALLEAGNVLEQITANSFDQIDAQSALRVKLSDYARQLLGDDALTIDVQTDEGDAAAKRITVAVAYQESVRGQGSLRLTTWVYDRGGR